MRLKEPAHQQEESWTNLKFYIFRNGRVNFGTCNKRANKNFILDKKISNKRQIYHIKIVGCI